jgi:hypothetical protein
MSGEMGVFNPCVNPAKGETLYWMLLLKLEVDRREKKRYLGDSAVADGVLELTLLASLPLGVLQTLLVTADGDDAGLLLEGVADSAGADLSVLQVAISCEKNERWRKGCATKNKEKVNTKCFYGDVAIRKLAFQV